MRMGAAPFPGIEVQQFDKVHWVDPELVEG